MQTENVIQVENVEHVFQPNSSHPIRAIHDIHLEIRRGEYVAIVGHNGSGKSTLAKHLNGLLLPSHGDIWVKTWNTKVAGHRLDIRSTVGMVFQTPDNQLVATIVEEDVAFGPENLGIPPDEIRTRVDWALDAVGMRSKRRHAPHLLSGGEKQRVAIAGVLAMRPEVLVLDESTALLDPVGRESVLEIIRRLNREGITIVAITHIMSEAALADRVIVMEHGAIAMEGTPREVFGQPLRLRELQLDAPEITQLSQRLHLRRAAFPGITLSVKEFADAFAQSWPSEPGIRQTDSAIVLDAVSAARSAPPAPAKAFSSTRPVITVSDLAYTWMRGTPLESTALRHVNCQVYQGETVGIIGRTGSGKSTLIQHFNALLPLQRGAVKVLDYDLKDGNIDKRALRRRVGLVFQFPETQLFERYVGDDVAFGPWEMGLRGDELSVRVRVAMDAVGLGFDAFKDRPLYSLSGGERRRAALAGVLAMKPEILVLDEPTAGLDPRGHHDILARIMALKREWGMTLVIVSHNMEDIARLCDQVYVLEQGEMALAGTPEQVFAQPRRMKELGLGVPQVTEALRALSEMGLPVSVNALTVEQAEDCILQMPLLAAAHSVC